MDDLFICNSSGDCIEISKEVLIEQCVLLGLFDPADGPAIYRSTFNDLLRRADRLLNALHGLSVNKESEAAKAEYLEAKRAVEVSTIYFKVHLQDAVIAKV